MDKMSIRVLKLLKEYGCPVSRKLIIAELGTGASKSIHYLLENGYIKQVMKFGGVRTDPSTGRGVTYDVPTGDLEIDVPGLAYLESIPDDKFDKWLTRLSNLWSFLAGIFTSQLFRIFMDYIKGA